MNRSGTLALFVGSCFVIFYGFGLAQEKVRTLDLVNKGVQNVDPATMALEIRQQYIERFRAEGADERGSGDLDFLIRLRDDAAIEGAAREWERSAGRSRGLKDQLKHSASPWVIPKLAEFLYHDEEPPTHRMYPNPEMGVDLGFSHATAVVIRDILIQSPEVPASVKGWASRYEHDYYLSMLVDMQLWWETNRQRLEDEQYDRLEPLPDAAMETELASPEPLENFDSSPASQTPASLATDAQEPSPAVDEAAAQSQEGESRLWPYGLAAVLAALGIGAFILRFRAS